MEENNRVEVIDRNGWSKEYPLQKNIIHIGSDPRNDIVLETWHGAGIAQRHIQIIRMPEGGGGYQLVNLGHNNILLGRENNPSAILEPLSTINITDNERLTLGDFVLAFRTGAATSGRSSSQEAASKSMGLRFFLPQNRLGPDNPIDGTLVVRNRGGRDAVQFLLEVIGLGTESYELGPAPIIFPEAERDVFFTLKHTRQPTPIAGEHRVTIRATAPDDYPGESVAVTQVVHILPFYSHKLRLSVPEAAKK